MEKYEKYKSLGFEWIGDIPKHWEVKKLKYLTRILSGFSPEQCQPSESAGTIPYIKVDNLNVVHAGVDKTKEFTTENFIVSIKPSILFPKRGAAIALNKVALVNEPFSMDTNIMGLELESDEIEIKYIYYLLKSISLISIADTSTIPQINNKHIEPIVIPFLGLAAQTAIAAYLDEKTARIDKLIANKQRLIELLKEERTAIINHAVTRGTNPKAKLKLSGIEWLGDIPAHWEVKKLKYVVLKVGSGITPTGGASVYQSEGIPLLRSQNIYNDGLRLDDIAFISDEIDEQMANSRIQEDDVLLNITGASIGRCFYVPKDFGKGNVNQHVCIIRPIQNLLKTNFLHSIIISGYGQTLIDICQTGANREGLNFQQIKSFDLPIPDMKEQVQIIDFIETHTTRIDTTISKIEKEIELLQEYRTTLISEVVTGKIKVA